jgi:hypothetical protein
MTGHGTAHWDVAAYALGVLDPRDVVRCELHLAECGSCAAELDALVPTAKLLADVDHTALREAEEAQFADRLLDAVRSERQRSRSRRRILAGAGTGLATVMAGFALFAGSTWLAGDPDSFADRRGEHYATVDPDSGVEAEVVLAATDWGTRVSFQLSSVTGPLVCELLVMRADGTTEVVGSWQVWEDGYGTPQRPDPLSLDVPTATDLDELTGIQVRATEPDGDVTTLVTVPL